VTLVQIIVWNLADSKTSLEELHTQLPSLAGGDIWIANEAQERFGLVSTSGSPPNLESVRELIGKDPEVIEEFDTLE
jgi:hypothetical protein